MVRSLVTIGLHFLLSSDLSLACASSIIQSNRRVHGTLRCSIQAACVILIVTNKMNQEPGAPDIV
jgi:hypothetical protein